MQNPSSFTLAFAIAVFVAHAAPAQTHYHNLDGGRPGRVEDAAPTERYALDIDLAPFQFERVSGGTNRLRTEPKLSYGLLPFTEVEVRAPIVRVDPPRTSGARSVTGIAGVAIGALHAFNLETPHWPAVALGAEVALPAGQLAGAKTSYAVKGLATKTLRFARLHLNAGGGTYSVRSAPISPDTASCPSGGGFTLPGQQTCGDIPPIIFDSPCNVRPSSPAVVASSSRMCMPAANATYAQAVAPASNAMGGSRWFAGAGVDHAFALHSILLTADVVAEHFVGLYRPVDWTAEAGFRQQMTPTLTMNGGLAWHFAGTIRSASIMAGLTYDLATPPLFGSRRHER